nr:hypothetical protein [uncultured Pedobacter sp.]
MRIRLVDTFSVKSLHEQFNASLLVMLSLISNDVEYLAGESSKNEVYKLLKEKNIENIRYKKIGVIEGEQKTRLLLRYLISCLSNIIILCFSSKKDLLIYNYNNLFSVRIINAINKILNRKILIFCHGELELLIPTQVEVGILHRILSFLCNSFFKNKDIKFNKQIYFVVMGEKIKSNLTNLINRECLKQFISVDHPYIFEQNAYPVKKSGILNFGTVGLLNKLKGLDNLILLSERLNLKGRSDLKISVTGKVTIENHLLTSLGIDLPSNNGASLSRSAFDERIKKLDYIIFVYPSDSYRLIASGAIMDCIKNSIPVIALRNDYFEYLFSKLGGFGILVDTIEQMVDVINKLSACPSKFKDIDFNKIREIVKPEFIKEMFKEKLSEIEFL